MSSAKSITIVGGGLAGLALGIGLRQRGIPATVWEAGRYPRHRVCGEFISGRGQAVLERLGLLDLCRQAGAIEARTVLFVAGNARSPVRALTVPALCVSRHTLDATLAASFRGLGGELRTESRWTASPEPDGVVHASGRRPAQAGQPSRWFGVKAHVPAGCRVPLEADLEMHLSADGYVGMNRLGGGEVNVCGLFRSREGGQRPDSRQDWLRGAPDSLLRERLKEAVFEPESFCSVAGLQLSPRRAAAQPQCCIGDALTMTPPATGNGMSMAFESAEMALAPLADFSEGRLDWPAARREIARRCDAAFGPRLAWARALQWMLMSPVSRSGLGRWLLRSDRVWQILFARTRG